MKLSPNLRERLDPLRDGPPLIVGVGPILDQVIIKRSVAKGTFLGGNHPLPDGVYNEALTGFVVRLYTYSPRKRDGVWILKKADHLQVFHRKRVPTAKGDKRMKTKAIEFAKRVAKEYDWFYIEGAKHNQEVPDFYQAYVELGEVIDQ